VTRSVAFSRSLYRVDAVEASAAAYSGCARVVVTVAGSDIVATFEDPDPELGEDLFDGFANHALFETIVRQRAEVSEHA
jgi:hypothetical protein